MTTKFLFGGVKKGIKKANRVAGKVAAVAGKTSFAIDTVDNIKNMVQGLYYDGERAIDWVGNAYRDVGHFLSPGPDKKTGTYFQ